MQVSAHFLSDKNQYLARRGLILLQTLHFFTQSLLPKLRRNGLMQSVSKVRGQNIMLNVQAVTLKKRGTPEEELIEMVATEMLKGIDCATDRWISEIERTLQGGSSDTLKLARIGQIIGRFRTLVQPKPVRQAKPCRSA
jgi:hypothetical protein